MKVKIEDVVYDPNQVRIMLILTDKDKEIIRNMPADRYRYAAIPSNVYTSKEIDDWMNLPEDDNADPD